MNPFDLLFGFKGRINRAKFWLAALIYAVFFLAVVGITMSMSSSLDALFGVGLIAYIPLIVSGIAVGISGYTTATRAAGGCCCSMSGRCSSTWPASTYWALRS